MRIADVARRAGTSPRMLRYYEDEGLLTPGRTENGYRVYSHRDLQTAIQIVSLARAGLTLASIAVVLPCATHDATTLHSCPRVAPQLLRQLTAIREQIDVLTASASAIQVYLDHLLPLSDEPGTPAPGT